MLNHPNMHVIWELTIRRASAVAVLWLWPVDALKVSFIARADRIKRMRLPGKAVNRLVRTALVPASMHGTGVTGVTDTAIKSLVSVAHAAFGNATGRSAYARLSLSGGMPGCREAVQPIVDWARAFF